MRWFGRSWGAPICHDSPWAMTPAGQSCMGCGEPIEVDANGVMMMHVGATDAGWGERPWHLECHMRGFIGGANHQIGRCTCCGGTEPPDPPGLSRREAAALSVRLWSEKLRCPMPPLRCENPATG